MDRSANMRAIRSKHTAPEKTVRSLVHRLGFRFRLHRKDLPGKPDLVFASRRKVIFVNGCFWHHHQCKPSLIPQSNREFWLAKLLGNKSRDKRKIAALRRQRWKALTIWQCELKNLDAVAERVRLFLG